MSRAQHWIGKEIGNRIIDPSQPNLYNLDKFQATNADLNKIRYLVEQFSLLLQFPTVSKKSAAQLAAAALLLSPLTDPYIVQGPDVLYDRLAQEYITEDMLSKLSHWAEDIGAIDYSAFDQIDIQPTDRLLAEVIRQRLLNGVKTQDYKQKFAKFLAQPAQTQQLIDEAKELRLTSMEKDAPYNWYDSVGWLLEDIVEGLNFWQYETSFPFLGQVLSEILGADQNNPGVMPLSRDQFVQLVKDNIKKHNLHDPQRQIQSQMKQIFVPHDFLPSHLFYTNCGNSASLPPKDTMYRMLDYPDQDVYPNVPMKDWFFGDDRSWTSKKIYGYGDIIVQFHFQKDWPVQDYWNGRYYRGPLLPEDVIIDKVWYSSRNWSQDFFPTFWSKLWEFYQYLNANKPLKEHVPFVLYVSDDENSEEYPLPGWCTPVNNK